MSKSKASSNRLVKVFLQKRQSATFSVGFRRIQDKTLQDAMNALGLKMFTETDLTPIIDRIIAANKPQIEKLGKNAFGMLMGATMKEVRGRANPELVGKLLRERL